MFDIIFNSNNGMLVNEKNLRVSNIKWWIKIFIIKYLRKEVIFIFFSEGMILFKVFWGVNKWRNNGCRKVSSIVVVVFIFGVLEKILMVSFI